MHTYSSPFRYLAIFSTALLMLSSTLSAQGIGVAVQTAQKAMQAKEYTEARALYAEVIKDFGRGAIEEYGPKFGSIYYFKGFAEWVIAQQAKGAKDQKGVQKWNALAKASFKACYEKFPNTGEHAELSTNAHHSLSLQMWATIEAASGKHAEAVELYNKFIKAKSAKDKFHPTTGTFYANLARSYYSLETPNIAQGSLHFGKALENKQKANTSDDSIANAFLAFSSAAVKLKSEAKLVDFVNEHRSSMLLDSYKMSAYTPFLLKMASEAVKSKMYTAAYIFYGMIPNTSDVIESIEEKTRQLAGRKAVKDGADVVDAEKLQADLEKMKKQVSSGEPVEVPVLMGLAYLNEQTGNRPAVYAILSKLEKDHSKSKHRESNLFNLVNTTSSLGKVIETAEFGQTFLDDFPKSENASAVKERMLVSLFFRGEYKKSLEVSSGLIKSLEAKGASEAHDVCLFVKGGSHYYLGQVDSAQPELDKHVKSYPNSKLAMHAAYYRASNLTRKKEWIAATAALNEFINKYPDPKVNNYLPNAIYDLANSYYSDSKYDDALKNIERLESDFAGATVLDLAYNLKGNISESTEKYAQAEKSYATALQIAESKDHKRVAAEALNYLIGMLSAEKIGGKENTRTAEALPYYDKFVKEHKDSPFKSQVAVYSMHALQANGRGAEGLNYLKSVIVETAATSRQFFLKELVDTYASVYTEQKGNTPEKLRKELGKVKIASNNKRALALIRIAVITSYEDALRSPEVKGNKKLEVRYGADIKALFGDLKKEFKPADLGPDILVRIADYVRTKTSSPKESLPYYEEILKRKNKEFEGKALLGVADVMGRSSNAADKKKAITTLEKVLDKIKDDKDDKDDKEARGEALARLVELHSEGKSWANTEKYARLYISEKNTAKAAEISFLFALSFDKRKKYEDALSNYAQVGSRYTGYLEVSAPSMKRVLEIMWERNHPIGHTITKGERSVVLKKSDRQKAYEDIGSRYLRQTGKIRKDNREVSEEAKKMWDEVAAVVKKFENSGEVKTLAEIKKEAGRITR